MKDYVNISTKVSRAVFDALTLVAKRKRLTIYEMLQMVADTFVRYCSAEHEVTPELERAMKLFEGLDGWGGAMNLSAADMEVVEATYFLGAKKKRGLRAVHVRRPMFGMAEQTENVQVVLERTLEAMLPKRYTRLRELAVNLECGSILELLDYMIERGEAQVEGMAVESPDDGGVVRYKRLPHYAPQ